uniref:Uncharacterized protein n=1 Tax=Setaria digitata TaxID=48799 RepID=A0A915Q2M2_9BILA
MSDTKVDGDASNNEMPSVSPSPSQTSTSLPSTKQQTAAAVNVIPPPASNVETQRAPLAEAEQSEYQNLKHRGSIWDTYVEMTDVAERKRRMTRHLDSTDQSQHLADLGKLLLP